MHNNRLPTKIFVFAVITAVSLFIVTASAIAAPPTLTYLYPAGAQRGQTVDVVAGGAFPNWPVETWCDNNNVTFTPSDKNGKFQVTVNENADAGICYVRIFDGEGASKLVPFVVGTQRESNEVEPNNSLSDANTMNDSQVVNGKLEKRGDLDAFRVELKKGETLIASVDGNFRLGSPMDAVLQIVDSKGFVLDDNHDARGLDPMIVYTAPVDGSYFVRLFAFPSQPNSTVAFAGGGDYIYRLTLTTGPMISHVLPLAISANEKSTAKINVPIGWNFPDASVAMSESRKGTRAASFFSEHAAGDFAVDAIDLPTDLSKNSSPQSPQMVQSPVSISGTISKPDMIHAYEISAKKGEKITFAVKSSEFGFLLDPVLEIVDSANKVLSRTDDTDKKPDPKMAFTAPVDGHFKVFVSDLYERGGTRFAYRLDISPTKPDFALKLESDSFTAKAGATAEVKITVERLNKHDEPIEVRAINLPPGWKVEPIASTPKSDTEKTVTLKLTAEDKAESGPFIVIGKSDGTERMATFVVERNQATHTSAWVTPTE